MSKNITSASIVAGLLVLLLVSGLWDDQSVPPGTALLAAASGAEPALSAANSPRESRDQAGAGAAI